MLFPFLLSAIILVKFSKETNLIVLIMYFYVKISLILC